MLCMSIERITAPTYKTSDGQKFEKLADAQFHELELFFPPREETSGVAGKFYDAFNIVSVLMHQADFIMDILSTTSAINGGIKKRTKAEPVAA